ncbi:MAG: TonB-dependent receptor [Flavobacteriales bacterium]|nr:TonB-dependent receptor [Flavobacteriales bacterium]
MLRTLLLGFIFLALSVSTFGQTTSIEGHISSGGERMPFVYVVIKSIDLGVTTDKDGRYHMELQPGKYTVEASFIGYTTSKKNIEINKGQHLHLDFDLRTDVFGLDQVVVTSTRNEISRKDSPITVNVLGERIFEMTQASTMSQGLSFTPGLRVDLNCQNCGLPDVKMNGLAGAYSQILIDGRATYSALSGVYGLEQIPANMIERIEVVKGGGSSLYGANAIAGTINVITKDPIENSFTIGGNTAIIGGQTSDQTLTFNSSTVSEDYNSGVSFFGNFRDRGEYDANDDGFSELSKIKTLSFGTKAFYKPTSLSRFGLEMHIINDYRRGGNMFDKPPHQTDVTEQTEHDIFSGQLSYEFYGESMNDKFSTYISFQTTDRSSYYGGGGNSTDPDEIILASNYYGDSEDISLAAGFQYSHSFETSTFTGGFEAKHNNVVDRMPGYNRTINQTVDNYGLYLQYEFKPIDRLSVLLGGRYDYTPITGIFDYGEIVDHNDIEMGVFTPRASVMYDITSYDQLRLTFAQGFRPPQAFDEDLHIETIGGTAKIVRLDPDLKPETSNSITIGYERNMLIGSTSLDFTVDGFYTQLINPFINVPIFDDGSTPENVTLVEKRNGSGAKVMGTNMELNTYISEKFNFQVGATFQKSRFDEEEVLIEGEDEEGNHIDVSTEEMLKSPDAYGYMTLQYLPLNDFSTSVTGIYTGRMLVANQTNLELRDTPSFFELGVKLSYDLHINKSLKFQLSTGVQNLLNSYQSDFEIGADRDAGYIYGPSQPRTFYVGAKIGIF